MSLWHQAGGAIQGPGTCHGGSVQCVAGDFVVNEEGRRVLVQATNTTMVVGVAVLSMLRWSVLGFGDFPLPALGVVIGGLLNALHLRRKGSLDVAAWTLIILLTGALFFAGLNTGGFSGPVVLLAPVIPVFSMLLVPTGRAWIALVLVSLVLASILYFDYYGYVPQNPNGPGIAAIGRFVALLSVCLLCTLIVRRFALLSQALFSKIERQSVTDFLTGVFNRRGIEAILLSEAGRARRTGSWLSVLMADVDHFKRYNDTQGHQSGDECLVRVAQIIGSCSGRTADVVGRFGGEEFVVILPDTDPAGACKVAEDIRRVVLAQDLRYEPGGKETLSLTLGVVSALGPAIDDVSQLIREADEALYRGKRDGRNRVVSVVLGET